MWHNGTLLPLPVCLNQSVHASPHRSKMFHKLAAKIWLWIGGVCVLNVDPIVSIILDDREKLWLSEGKAKKVLGVLQPELFIYFV